MALIFGLSGWAAAVASDRGDPVTYYVSVGDSYASGEQPGPRDVAARDGFAYQVLDELRRGDSKIRLMNFACSGETGYAMVFEPGCDPGARAPDGAAYSAVPQAVAAADFIAQHHDRIRLITVVMGANDLIPCLDRADQRDAQACAEARIPQVALSLNAFLGKVRGAVGNSIPIIGLSYINVFLADALKQDSAASQRAEFSTALFRNYLNPVLLSAYSSHGANFVDTTALAGGYLPQTEKTWLPEYGTVTASIGRVCALSYYCTAGDPHPNRAGHALIAGQIDKLAQT
ncbi:MAG: hypothetical protein JO044_19605 [Mycobacteriaceae bacterium]|nr:hypothetical protein [Mycobacteriaceae bacterium]